MKYHYKVLIIDDEEGLRAIIDKRLSRNGYEVHQAGTAQTGISLLQDHLFDVVLLDLRLPDGDGLSLLPQIKQRQPDLQVIMLTGHGTLESAIEAMKSGAFDYLTKPCNLSELEITLQKALEQRKLLIENTGLRQVVNRQNFEPQIIGESEGLKSIKELTRKMAQVDTPILIQGESGTGKELFARALHVWGARKDQAYIPVNSGAIPEAIMESELFGYEKGAFTGANAAKMGLVEMADRGTLFLDEIGEMPLQLQVKLLRFLETGEFRRVGDTRMRRVDVRIIAATNRELQHEVEKGRFRQDLFYRLNGLTLNLPPLRERREDIIPLAEYFLTTKTKVNSTVYYLSDKAKQALLQHEFPGNVREMAHLIERAVILAEGPEIYPSDLWPGQEHKEESNSDFEKETVPLKETARTNGTSSDDREKGRLTHEFLTLFSQAERPTLDSVERAYILGILKETGGNRNQAAKILGISVRNLYRKIEEYRDYQ